MAMIRDRLQKLTLIQKLVSMILAILFLVTSLLLVNAIVSVQIKRFVVSLVDDKVSALLDNTAISRQFDQIFAETHSFLTQFPRELETVAHAEAEFKTQMASIAADPEWMRETIEPQLAPFVRHTEDLFELAQGLAHHLVRLQGHLRANHDTIAQLDQAVLEHEFQLSAHSHDKADYIHQLAIIVPALFEIHHELRIHLLHIRHNFLGTAERLQQHREAAGKRLEEINLALRAIPPGSEDTRAIFTTAQGQIVAIAQEVVHLNAAIDQYRHLHDRTIHTKSLLLSRIDA
ncbi:MAG: hypothetical protein QNJ22_21780, partial [Desulfosarcinaceae bacterium]|nr:hypothetical protein [Desulfosarcinaceae bacterium]